MKFSITMKDPDGVYDSLYEAAKQSVAKITGITETERGDLTDARRDDLEGVVRKWFQYGECLTVEIDTEAMTATVKEV